MRVPLERDVRTARARARRSCDKLRRRAGSAGWDPSALGSKLRGWWKGDNPAIVLAGGRVVTWPDSSGNGNEFTQGVAAARFTMGVVNGLACPVGDGVQTFMDTVRLLDNALFFGAIGSWCLLGKSQPAVVPAGTATTGAMLLRTDTSNRLVLNIHNAGLSGSVFDSAGFTRTATTANVPVAGVTAFSQARFLSGTSINAQQSSGALATTAAAANFATNYAFRLRMGWDAGVQFFNGPLCEFFALNSTITAAELALLEQYLLRWGPN